MDTTSSMPPGQAACTECGRTLPADEVIRYGESTICAICKPLFFQKLKESGLPGQMRYAGFWIRFGAKFIDGIITGIANLIVTIPMTLLMTATINPQDSGIGAGFIAMQVLTTLVQLAIPAAYTTFFLGKFAATPGKMLCGLKVVLADGGKVSYPRALGRHFAEFLSTLILWMGYVMAAWDGEKRTLHDRICSTRVVLK